MFESFFNIFKLPKAEKQKKDAEPILIIVEKTVCVEEDAPKKKVRKNAKRK